MTKLLFSTSDDWVGMILRLTIALIILPHGAQKLFGWFGGPGFSNAMAYLTQDVRLPWIIGLSVILLETLGASLLLAGVGTRVWAVALIVHMIGIIVVAHLSNGFFMNWEGTQKGEGFEYHLLVIGLCTALLLSGGGKYSVDSLITQ